MGLRFVSSVICGPFQPVSKCGIPIGFAPLAAVSVFRPVPHSFELVPSLLGREAELIGKRPRLGVRLPIVRKIGFGPRACSIIYFFFRKGLGNPFFLVCGILRNVCGSLRTSSLSSLAHAIRLAPPLCLFVYHRNLTLRDNAFQSKQDGLTRHASGSHLRYGCCKIHA